jgi:integrase
MRLTVNFCKGTEKLVNLAESGKLWHGSGYFWLKASKASEKKHAFYFRHAETKKRKVLKDEHGVTLRPQSLRDLGGEYRLAEIESLATERATGQAPLKRSDLPTLRDVLDRFMTLEHANHGESITEASQRDIRREIAIFAYDWLNRPASDITPEAVEARVAEIKDGKYRHPLFKMDDEPRAAICEDLGIGVPRKEFYGSKLAAHKFARYLRAVLTKGTKSQRVFDSGDDPVTQSEALKAVGKINYKRPTLPLREDEIATIFNATRSNSFDPFVWQSILCLRLAILTGYRVGDIVTLHDGNDHGDTLRKGPGECVKRPTASHTLPVSTQMREILDEAKAMRDGDEDMLRNKFAWKKAELLDFRNVRAVTDAKPTPFIFPSFNTWTRHKQPSQTLRPAMKRFKFKPQDRMKSATEWLGFESTPKPHDCRATFATFAYSCDLDLLTVAAFMNHTIPKNLQTPHYVGGMSDGAEIAAKKMQKVSDAILKVAKQARKDKLAIIDGGQS